ncbi:hypothetical protein [Microbacterium sp. SD291]|uniref:DUF6993 domain-containing protein n=1 Tax=Microbacterium sp. SD291 TaxID=2782007 RepID=UPI0027DE8BA1|nr:hypothetical protein [Microbacterium sp. SD291]
MLRWPASASRATIAAAAAVSMAVLLTACGTPLPVGPVRTSTPADPDANPAPTTPATAESPSYVADGTAADNLPLFAATTAQVWASDQRGSGRAYVDALVASGFDRNAMQVTEDLTTVGEPVESLQFSVRWGDSECLVGQVGPSTGEPVSMVMPQLAEGRCLIGDTRPIDW